MSLTATLTTRAANRERLHPLLRLAAGAIAGAAGTAPMTAAMVAWFRWLPAEQQHPLPPRTIVERLADEADVPLPDSEVQRVRVTLVAHFAYGAGTGALFGLFAPRFAARTRLRAVAAGMAFGIGVWAASYLGWLPAAGILRQVNERPAQRNALMFVAHLIWGGATGLVARQLRAHR